MDREGTQTSLQLELPSSYHASEIYRHNGHSSDLHKFDNDALDRQVTSFKIYYFQTVLANLFYWPSKIDRLNF
jgi:hypothetical protein